jgi:hypothetical protein
MQTEKLEKEDTLFDDGYFKDAAGAFYPPLAGAIRVDLWVIGHKVDLSPSHLTTSSMTDILMDGRKEELLSVWQK